MYRISILHNFETAHRLSHPDAPTKCQSIHGHSWWVRVWVEGEQLDDQGMLVEFGRFKKLWRGFIDDHVDHHLILHHHDPMRDAILSVQPTARLLALPFHPTTEHLSRWLYARASDILRQAAPHRDDLRIQRIHLQETRVNGAEYHPQHGTTLTDAGPHGGDTNDA